MRWDLLTPAEIAGLDTALKDGIAGALTRSSGLLVMKTGSTGDGGWICAFPPYGLSFVAAKEWARRHQLNYARDDLYLTHNEVVRAGADLCERDVEASTRSLQASFLEPESEPAPAPRPPPVRPTDSRGSRAWTQAFQAGFRKTACPVVSDDDTNFIALLEIADRRQPRDGATNAGSN